MYRDEVTAGLCGADGRAWSGIGVTIRWPRRELDTPEATLQIHSNSWSILHEISLAVTSKYGSMKIRSVQLIYLLLELGYKDMTKRYEKSAPDVEYESWLAQLRC
jgi:hypothetical protein